MVTRIKSSNITDGSITNADLATDIAISTTGNVTLGQNIIFEGSTVDSFETTLTTVNPTADRTVSIPNATDTLVGKATTDTLTNKTLTTPIITTPIVNTGISLKNAAASAGYADFYEDSDNGSNYVRVIGPASTATVTLTLPAATDTVIGKATTDTLTNKSIDLGTNTVTGSVAEFNAALQSESFTTLTGSETLTNKILTTPVIAEIDSGSTITLDATTDIVLDAGGADVILKDDGTIFGGFSQSAGQLVIKSSSSSTPAITMSGANVTIEGNLIVSGTETIVDSTTVSIQNAFVFEGATADTYESTLTTVDPTADRTIKLPNATGTLITHGMFSGDATIADTGAITLSTVNSNVGQAGSSTAIPVVTVNAKGLVTAVSTAAITTSLTVGADTGTNDAVALASDVLDISGGSNITTTVSNNDISVALDASPSITALTTSANVNVGGTVVFEGSTADSFETTLAVTDPTADRTITIPNATGTLITHGMFSGDATIADTGAITFATVNSNVGSAGSSTAIPVVTVNAKGLVTAVSTAAITTTLTVGADSGSNDAVALASDVLDISGGTNITTTVSNNDISVALDASPSITNLTLGGSITFEGATADSFETTITATDPTADRTITLQNASGTLAFLTDVTGGATPGNFTTISLDNNIVFEGGTDDSFETTLAVAEPTADRTVTIPDVTGTVTLLTAAQTLTNKGIDLGTNTLTGSLAEFNTALQSESFASLSGSETLTNKTLTTPVISSISNTGTLTLPTSTDTVVGRATTDTLTNKTLTSAVLNTGVSGSAVADEDDMSSNSETKLATQQSIKAYVDTRILTEDTIAELNDTTITSPGDGSLLFYDTATSKWIDNVISGDATVADTGAMTLATVNSNVGQAGSSTAIPVVTVNAKGLVTAVSTAAISSALTVAADSGSNDAVTVGTDTLTFAGGTNITTTVTNNQISTALDASPAVTSLVFEGATADSFETTLTVVDPTADRTLSLPNSSGTLGLASNLLNATSRRGKFVATNGQTTFTGSDANGLTLAYDAGYLDVYLNGVHLDPSDYTASNGTSIVLGSGAATGDILYVVAYNTVASVSNDADDITAGTLAGQYIEDDAISLAKMAGIARGKIIYGDASGDPAVLSVGSAGQVLKSDGTDISWGAVAASGATFIFEGATADSFETTLTATDPTADRTITLPNSTGTVSLIGNTETLTNKTLTTPVIAEIDSGSTITLDATTDIVLDADGGDIFFKDDGTIFGSATNNSGNLIIKSGTTTAATFTGANVTLAGTVGSGAITSTGSITSGGSFIIGSADINETDLEKLDGITNGTVAANKSVVVDGNKDIGTFRNLTIDGTFSDGNYTFDTSGNVSGLGTVGSGAITSSGVVTATGFTIGSAVITEAELEILDGASLSTTELNYLDITTLGTSQASKAVTVDADGDLIIPDSDKFEFGSGSDMTLYHDGTNSYITNKTGALKVATETSGIAITLGHGTSEVTVADNLTVAGNLTVSGTQTVVDTVTMQAQNAILFEGATADSYETILTMVDPTADRTVTLPNATDTLVGKATTDTLTNKTLTSAVLNTSVSGSAVLDEDDFTSDSATKLATQQSIKAYVDTAILTEDTIAELNDTTITGTPADNEVLAYDTTASKWINQTPAEASLVSLTGSETLTNKTLASPTFTTNFTIGSATITEAELEILDGATVTTAELNIMDGDTSASSVTLADADRMVVNDDGTMKQVAVTDMTTYIGDPIAMAIALG